MLLALLRGKIFNYSVSVVFSLTVAGWLQAALMNSKLGTLTGDPLVWTDMAWSMVGNLCIWAAVLVAVLTLMHLYRALWKKTICFISAMLVVMQLVPAVGIFVGIYDGRSSCEFCARE